MSIEKIKTDLQVAIQQAEHKPGEWAQTVQSMGGICCPGEPFQIGKPWPQEQPWANFSYKRDSWLAVAAVNAAPALLAEIDRLEGRKRLCPLHGHEECLQCMWPPRERSENDRLKTENERLRGLLEEIEALRSDALRYRWLRDLAASQDLRYPLTGKPDEIDATVDAGMTGPVYRCHSCNSITPPPEPYRAYVRCACGETTAATAAQADHPDAGVFAWVYARPGTDDVQISRTKQHYPGNWVENGGYTITELYTGPVNGEPAGWAYRVKLGTTVANWKVSVAEPCYGGEPGDLEVMALYKREPAKRLIEVWVEGYRAMGEAGKAHCLGEYEAVTFDEAVQQHLTVSPENAVHFGRSESGTWSYWGCELFDNEADARKNFG